MADGTAIFTNSCHMKTALNKRSLGALFMFLLGALLASNVTARAQSVEPLGDADACWRSAWNFLQLAEASNSPPQESRVNMGKALEQGNAALKIRPDFFRAAALVAHCSYRLAQMERDPQRHDDQIRNARDRFGIAAHCTGANTSLFQEWGEMLVFESDLPRNTRKRLALLQEARHVYESGIKLSNFAGERAKLDRDLGTCLVLLAALANSPAEKLTLYEEAIGHFESTTNVEAVATSPQVCAHWGIALVESGKLAHDYQLLRQAIERLGTALEGDPKNLEARYNMVCAYALLDDPVSAMRHLQICLENDDSNHTYYNTAAHDPDLDSLRSTRQYNEVFGEKAKTTLPAIAPPRISN